MPMSRGVTNAAARGTGNGTQKSNAPVTAAMNAGSAHRGQRSASVAPST